MRAIVSEASRRHNGVMLEEAATTAAFRTMSDRTSDLALAIGGSIRVRATGLPVTYDTFFDVLLTVFFVLALGVGQSELAAQQRVPRTHTHSPRLQRLFCATRRRSRGQGLWDGTTRFCACRSTLSCAYSSL